MASPSVSFPPATQPSRLPARSRKRDAGGHFCSALSSKSEMSTRARGCVQILKKTLCPWGHFRNDRGPEKIYGKLFSPYGRRSEYRRTVQTRATASVLQSGTNPNSGKKYFGVLPSSPHDSEIANLAIPALLTLTLDPLVSLVDTALVGRLGAQSLGGVGIASVIFTFSFAIFNFLSYATTPLVASAAVNNKTEEASRVVVHSLWIALMFSLTMTAVLYVKGSDVINVMQATPDVKPFAQAYLNVRLLSAPALLIQNVCVGAFRGHKDSKTPLKVALVSQFCNLSLDIVFIYGLGWGVVGAAAASVVAQFISAIGLLYFLLQRSYLRMKELKQLPTWAEARPILGAGSVLSIRTLAGLSAVANGSAAAAGYGAVAIAAHEICRQVWLLFALCVESVSIAGQALVARALGRNARSEARNIAWRLLQLSASASCFLGGIIALSAPLFPSLFTSDPMVAATTAAVIPLIAAFQPLNGCVFVMDGLLIGARDHKFVCFSMLVAASITWGTLMLVRQGALDPFVTALGFVAVPTGGVLAVWMGLQTIVITRGLLGFVRLSSKHSPLALHPKRS